MSRTDGRDGTGGKIEGSTRGPRGPKKTQNTAMNLITRGQGVYERTLFEGSAQTNFVMRTTNMPFQSIPPTHNRTEKYGLTAFACP